MSSESDGRVSIHADRNVGSAEFALSDRHWYWRVPTNETTPSSDSGFAVVVLTKDQDANPDSVVLGDQPALAALTAAIRQISPILPKVDGGIKKGFAICLRPRGRGIVPEKIVLLVCANQPAFIGIVLNPIDSVYEAIFVVGCEFVVRDVIKQTFEVIGRCYFCFQDFIVGEFGSQILQNTHHWFKRKP